VGEVIGRLAERVEKLLARFYAGVGHPGSSLVLRETQSSRVHARARRAQVAPLLVSKLA
jgi:hypothetical protein